ncbi:protein DENND6A [Arctopsyche grandis]|uniref:protein DENND6A n=1 Tax=Arctopsyche grandis TaxID=121162 RepID=UPI00406D8A42
METTQTTETAIEIEGRGRDRDRDRNRGRGQRLSQWIECICVVTFDLEVGQALESVHPAGVQLAECDKTNLCYLAFPDSNSGCMGDTRFHVRLRTRAPSAPTSTVPLKRYVARCPLTLQPDPTHFWGFVFFRQVKDPSLPRGYFQKSVVVLTRLPLINLMYKVCGIVAPRFFDHGEAGLEAACKDIDLWPPLDTGSLLLPLLGNVLHIFLPSQAESDSAIQGLPQPPGSISVSPRDVYSYTSLSCVLSNLHLLWELVLTAEPIVVMASSPTACSAMVQALVDLIHPLQYSAEYRPYFTIHDSEFKEFTKKQYNPPYVILGVTNPFFSKTLHHWPHTVRLDESVSYKSKLKRVGTAKTSDSSPGVYTQYKPYLTKDKTILKRLSGGSLRSERPAEVQAALVRRHMLELTHSFMIPLERYMASLMPLQKNISAFRAAPVPHPFNPEDFMNMLQHSGPHLTSGIKGDWAGLYRAFLKSPNFSAWFQRRYGELVRTLKVLQLEALAATDLASWAAGRQEVELVDMVLKLRKTINLNEEINLPLKSNTMSLLAEKLEDITKILPDDLKSILQNTT